MFKVEQCALYIKVGVGLVENCGGPVSVMNLNINWIVPKYGAGFVVLKVLDVKIPKC